MYRMKESEQLLNHYALVLPGGDISFRIHYWGIKMDHYDNPVHKHSFFEVCYVWDGEGEYTDAGEHIALCRGTFFCSRPGVVHQIRSRTRLSLLYVAFEPDESGTSAAEAERFRRLAADARVCVYDAEAAPSLALWKSLLLPEQDVGRLSDDALRSAAHTLLRSFADLFSPRRETAGGRARPADMLLQRAKLFIRDNLEENITAARVAEYLHISERHVSRLFAAAGIHESFGAFVRAERLRQAAAWLERTDMSIKDIAAKTGFSTVHSFSRAFAREMRLPPAAYRAYRSTTST